LYPLRRLEGLGRGGPLLGLCLPTRDFCWNRRVSIGAFLAVGASGLIGDFLAVGAFGFIGDFLAAGLCTFLDALFAAKAFALIGAFFAAEAFDFIGAFFTVAFFSASVFLGAKRFFSGVALTRGESSTPFENASSSSSSVCSSSLSYS